MSYRGFKRLLGESGLERKTRMLLGAGVILLMTASFYVYARQTEELATDQLIYSGRALAPEGPRKRAGPRCGATLDRPDRRSASRDRPHPSSRVRGNPAAAILNLHANFAPIERLAQWSQSGG